MNVSVRRYKKQRRARVYLLILAVLIAILLFVLTGINNVSAGAQQSKEKYYTSICVEKNDTLSEIAAEYGMSVKELKKINNIKSNTIYTGESLIVSCTE